MGPDLVVPVEPFFSEIPDLGQRLEQIGTENLFTVGPIEALDIGILIWLAGLDVTGFDALAFAPVREHLTRQLWPVIAADCLRPPVHIDLLRQERNDAARGDADANLDA